MAEERGRKNPEPAFPAIVARVVDSHHVVINRGSSSGIKVGQRFSIYRVANEAIKDPVTGEDLGRLETPKGTGRIIHVQEKMAILESDRPKPPLLLSTPPTSSKSIESFFLLPFDDPHVGDIAKPI